MKHVIRRRRPLRPRPSRAQLNHEITRQRRLMQLLQMEWLLVARRPDPDLTHARCLRDRIVECQDAIASLEAF